MENEEFQKLVLQHFGEMTEQFGKMNELFKKIDKRFDTMDDRFDAIDNRLAGIEESIKQHRIDTEKTAIGLVERLDKDEVLQLETSHIRRLDNKDAHIIEQMQLDINYLVRKTSVNGKLNHTHLRQ
jgi:hypothetical protein